jgi:hypothetical protein
VSTHEVGADDHAGERGGTVRRGGIVPADNRGDHERHDQCSRDQHGGHSGLPREVPCRTGCAQHGVEHEAEHERGDQFATTMPEQHDAGADRDEAGRGGNRDDRQGHRTHDLDDETHRRQHTHRNGERGVGTEPADEHRKHHGRHEYRHENDRCRRHPRLLAERVDDREQHAKTLHRERDRDGERHETRDLESRRPRSHWTRHSGIVRMRISR